MIVFTLIPFLRLFKHNLFSFYITIPIPTASLLLAPAFPPPTIHSSEKDKVSYGDQQRLTLRFEARSRPYSLNLG